MPSPNRIGVISSLAARNVASSATNIVCIVSILCFGSAHASWSSDPAGSLVVADGDSHQMQQKIAATPDGGFYVSWNDRTTDDQDVRLQRLDVDGDEQWPHNGILIATRYSNDWGQYGLAVDAQGNAYLAFEQDIGGTIQTVAQKITPDGSLAWGDEGITVSVNGGYDPAITVGGDGNIVVGFGTQFQKFDTSGQPLWGATGVTIAEPSIDYAYLADMHADADGNVVVALHAVVQFNLDYELFAQKLGSIDGAPLWGDVPLIVSDADAGVFLDGQTVLDGSGGAVFSWYASEIQSSCTQCAVRAQHVHADGTMSFAQNGVLVSVDTTRDHVAPAPAYDAAADDIYVVWRDAAPDDSAHGLYAQRIDSTGTRRWGEEGLPLAAFSTTEYAEDPIALLPGGGSGVLAAWLDNSGSHSVTRLDRQGAFVWPTDIVSFSTNDGIANGMTAALSTRGYVAFAWTTQEIPSDIHAQNVNMDGTLGVADLIFRDGFDP